MKNRSKFRFLELFVPAFFDAYPEIAPLLPPAFVLELLSEPDYLVRFFPDFGKIEFGFPSDDWDLK